MPEKEIEKLQAEKEKVERQLAQEQHKIQRLENRAAYYEKGKRRKRVQHIHSHAVPRENTRFSSFFDFTVLRPPAHCRAVPFYVPLLYTEMVQ
uniref:hypothetical protein n=1 Tax=Dialister sp. TaxID=1955814 RepID=UPI0040259BEB